MNNSKTQIFLVAHNQQNYKLPSGYSYIKVGNGLFGAEFNDSSQNNITALNPFYCELTALYWIWKNYGANNSIVGLAHYRRILCDDSYFNILIKKPLSLRKINFYLKSNDILLPKKIYQDLSMYEYYAAAHEIKDFLLMINSLCDLYDIPRDYIMNFVKKINSAHYYNMMICQKEVLDAYCQWAFPVLNIVYNKIDFNGRTVAESRAIGYLSERLLNIWLFINAKYKIKELPVIRLDKTGYSNLKRTLEGV